MQDELIVKLREKGVKFEKGLTQEEIEEIQREYDIVFPTELKSFYINALPVSNGFCNWRDKSRENVETIKKRLSYPTYNLVQEINEIDWNDEWGEEPESPVKREEQILKLLNKAPKLIPIYSHRYLASIKVENNPVFSIHGTDIIYYGENLDSYLKIEFGLKKYSDIDYNNIAHVPFWSELL